MGSRPNTTQSHAACGQLELPSGKYAEINDINPTLRAKARHAPDPILPKAATRRSWPATIREREPLVSSLTGPGRAGKQGCLAGSKGSLYEGGVLAGRPHGWGKYFVQPAPDVKPSLVYEGEWNKGIREGQGTYYYANGEVYNGQWDHNQRHGQGTLHYSNGDVYEGSWVQDQRHGTGTFTSSRSGSIFVGSYNKGLREGLGTLYMPSKGKKYVAEYVKDFPMCGSMLNIDSADLKLLPISSRLEQTIKSSTLNATLAMGPPAPIPKIQLAQPDKVLGSQIVELRKQQAASGTLSSSLNAAHSSKARSRSPSPGATLNRGAAAAATTSSSNSSGGGGGKKLTSQQCRVLSSDEISLLRHAFVLLAGGDDVKAHVQPRQLTELVVLAGWDPATSTSQTLMQRWKQLAKPPEQLISLDGFLHVALHHVEGASGLDADAEEAATGELAHQLEQHLTMQHQAFQQQLQGGAQPWDDPLLYDDGGNYDPPVGQYIAAADGVGYPDQEQWVQQEQEQQQDEWAQQEEQQQEEGQVWEGEQQQEQGHVWEGEQEQGRVWEGEQQQEQEHGQIWEGEQEQGQVWEGERQQGQQQEPWHSEQLQREGQPQDNGEEQQQQEQGQQMQGLDT